MTEDKKVFPVQFKLSKSGKKVFDQYCKDTNRNGRTVFLQEIMEKALNNWESKEYSRYNKEVNLNEVLN